MPQGAVLLKVAMLRTEEAMAVSAKSAVDTRRVLVVHLLADHHGSLKLSVVLQEGELSHKSDNFYLEIDLKKML